ncbi:MAG: sel1 repeat family protein [Proteobacteria bacterium]|nr:sel1 repeat family protein [Pseudomonadota bacterium]
MSYQTSVGMAHLAGVDPECLDVQDPEAQKLILKGIELAKTYMDVYDTNRGQKLKRLDPGDEKCVKAYKLAKAGERLDNTDAYRLLGDIYYRGAHFGNDHIDKDYERAWYYYNKALVKDDPIAMFRVGVMNYKGQSVIRDKTKGLSLIKNAAELGCPDAKQWIMWRNYFMVLGLVVGIQIVVMVIILYFIFSDMGR